MVWIIVDLTPSISKMHICVELRNSIDTDVSGDLLYSLELLGVFLMTAWPFMVPAITSSPVDLGLLCLQLSFQAMSQYVSMALDSLSY